MDARGGDLLQLLLRQKVVVAAKSSVAAVHDVAVQGNATVLRLIMGDKAARQPRMSRSRKIDMSPAVRTYSVMADSPLAQGGRSIARVLSARPHGTRQKP